MIILWNPLLLQEEPCRCLSSRWPNLGPTAANPSTSWNKESEHTRPTRNSPSASSAPKPFERRPSNQSVCHDRPRLPFRLHVNGAHETPHAQALTPASRGRFFVQRTESKGNEGELRARSRVTSFRVDRAALLELAFQRTRIAQSTAKRGIKIAPASLDVVNDILLRMNALLSSSLRPTHATLGGYVHSSQERS
jgi:hypothetical protein